MKRTMARPLPSGRMTRGHALAFAALVGAGGVWLLLEKVRGFLGAGAEGEGGILEFELGGTFGVHLVKGRECHV